MYCKLDLNAASSYHRNPLYIHPFFSIIHMLNRPKGPECMCNSIRVRHTQAGYHLLSANEPGLLLGDQSFQFSSALDTTTS